MFDIGDGLILGKFGMGGRLATHHQISSLLRIFPWGASGQKG
jgi:hypothetical protein